MTTRSRDAIEVFSTKLGWIAIRGRGKALAAVAFGHPTPGDAVSAAQRLFSEPANVEVWNSELASQLIHYAEGEPVDFGDVAVDIPSNSSFCGRVLEACRKIPYGQTRTYAALAAAAGSPAAARAVGNCMSRNRLPLIVPCHRVVASSGQIGHFSAPGGAETKRRLLAMENARFK